MKGRLIIGIGAALVVLLTGCSAVENDIGEAALSQALARAGTVMTLQEDAAARPTELPPHRMTLRVEYTLEGSEGRHSLTIDRRVDHGPKGAFRIVDTRRWVSPLEAPEGVNEGSEALFDGAIFASRRAHGPWIERSTDEDAHRNRLADASVGLSTIFGALKPYAVQKAGAAKTLLKTVRANEILLSRDPAVAPAPLKAEALQRMFDHEAQWGAWLAATHPPKKLSGRLLIHEADGVLLGGTLDAAGRATLNGVPMRYSIAVEQKVSALPKGASFTLPADRHPARRPRIWQMITSVLGADLAPIYGGGPRASK